jgi:predicted HNH restriction endonuclease
MSRVIRVSSEIYSRLESHVKGFDDNPSRIIERLLDFYEGVEPKASDQPKVKGTMKEINRKQFVQSVGATCKNWTWSWSFVNEKEKFVLFGAWDNLEDGNGFLILSKKWEIYNGRKKPGYTQALEHLDLVMNEGYQLKTYKMIGTNGGEENAKITSFETDITDRELKRIEGEYYAV